MVVCDPRDCLKSFEVGNRVKVVLGSRIGDIGSITHVDENTGVATIASDAVVR